MKLSGTSCPSTLSPPLNPLEPFSPLPQSFRQSNAAHGKNSEPGESERTPLLDTPLIQPSPNNYASISENSRHSRYHLTARFRGAELSQRTSKRNIKSFLCEPEPTWDDQFTSTDWVHDNIADAYRVKALRSRKDFVGRLKLIFDGSQGWILSALVGCVTAIIAYGVEITEAPISDWKDGTCSKGLFVSKKKCCFASEDCDDWNSWSKLIQTPNVNQKTVDFLIYVLLTVLLSTLSCLLTLTTKAMVPSSYQILTLDENLGASTLVQPIPGAKVHKYKKAPLTAYYSAAGSGVPEVRVILCGFVLRRYLSVKTLVIKTLAIVLSVSSGLSLGKEGPFVHIATCVGNIACRLFSKYESNDAKRREVLSAAAAAGLAVVFGAPIGGVLFSLEEVAYVFPAQTLFRTFFCCITAALTLKFLNPYGTKKIVMFEVRYDTDWQFFELVSFILVGILGGAAGAIFIKASRSWARSFRPLVQKWPLLEVSFVALITAVVSFWNPFTKLSVVKLLYHLASPCQPEGPDNLGLCPKNLDEIRTLIYGLCIAFIIKGLFTTITFGIKIPAGIYVPSMAVGGIGGRIIGHLVQWLVLRFPASPVFGNCAAYVTGQSCITPGLYALAAAGSTLCGVTRLSVTLVVILFELTGSLDHVLPFSLAILVAKWTADALEPLSIYVNEIWRNSHLRTKAYQNRIY